MERNDDFERRTVLRGAAGVLAAGVLAGCSGGNSSNGSGSGNGGSGGNGTTGDSGGGTGTKAGTGPTSTGTVSNTETGETSGQNAQVEQWLAGANNYNGSIADMTGSDTVEIAVGAGSDGFAFDPAAVRVSPDTTIRWTWTGRGGAHNVVAQGGAFDSGPPQVGENVTYETTLDQPGTHLYYCEPHRRLGMKGAVVVASA